MRGLRIRAAALLAALALGFGGAGDASAQSLPLPPGTVLTGEVFKPLTFSCAPPSLPSITNGADGNSYVCLTVTPPFVDAAPAYMVVTSVPTQYVRVYADGGSPNRPFMADPSTIRGLTPAQIQDVLALPTLPTMITIVTVPAGACVLVGLGAPAFGGTGGTAQEWAAGIPTGPNCQGVNYLPIEDYVNQQAIGAYALLYAPRAGGGNAGAVAAALDKGPYPEPFTDMDLVYKSLDLLNFGDPQPLRAALQQLDGEVYADFSSVAIGAGQLLLGAVREQLRTRPDDSVPVWQWLTGLGASGGLSGSGDSHDLDAASGGLAGGFEHRFDPALIGGLAFGYAYTGFSTSGISGEGSANTFALMPYARYAPGPWYVEGALGAAYNNATVNRTINFPGQYRQADGSPGGPAFLSQVETGYRLPLGPRSDVTPFAAMQGIVIGQHAFKETGAGAVDLNFDDNTTGSAYGVLGAEIAYLLPVGLAAPLRLNGRLGWAHEFGDTERTATAVFDGTPSGAAFTVVGAAAPRDAALFGLGMTLAMPSLDIFARYEGLAGDGASVQGGSAGLRFIF
jgi:outer membrane autotransporter protein